MAVRLITVLVLVAASSASIHADELTDLQAFAKAAKGHYSKYGEKQCCLDLGRETTDADLVTLGKMSTDQVQGLTIALCDKITDNGFLEIVNMPSLQHLSLPPQLSDIAYSNMAKRFPKVYSLSIGYNHLKKSSPVTTKGLKLIAEMPSILNISIHGTSIDDSCWAALAKSPRLMALEVSNSKLSGEGIERLNNCNKLNNIHLENLSLTTVGVSQIGKIEPLAILRIVKCGTSDQGLIGLSKHSRLSDISLVGDPISDDGVKSLANIKTIYQVTINSPQITDAMYAHLATMADLKIITIRGAKITAVGKADSQKAMPKVIVY